MLITNLRFRKRCCSLARRAYVAPLPPASSRIHPRLILLTTNPPCLLLPRYQGRSFSPCRSLAGRVSHWREVEEDFHGLNATDAKSEAAPPLPDQDIKHTTVTIKVNNGEISLDIFKPTPSSKRKNVVSQDSSDIPVIVYLPSHPQPLGPRSVKKSFRLGARRYEELRFEDAKVANKSSPQLSSEVDDGDQYTSPAMDSIGKSEQYDTPMTLALTPGAVVVQINYRALTFPQPVHDVLAGWDWIVENVNHLQEAESNDGKLLAGGGQRAISTTVGHATSMGIGVYGELVGGSLAIMLGLTECDPGAASHMSDGSSNSTARNQDYSWATNKARSSPENTRKAYVKAVVTRDAIVDWVLPPPIDTATSTASTSTTDASSSALQDLRDSLFRAQSHPSTYFDPFASPIHFLRTPSAAQPPAVYIKADTHDRPTTKIGKDEFDLLARLEEETALSMHPTIFSSLSAPSLSSQPVDVNAAQDPLSTSPATDDANSLAPATVTTTVNIDTTQRRKVPLRWPPSSLPHTLRMPDFLLIVGDADKAIPVIPSSVAVSSTSDTPSKRKIAKKQSTTSPSHPLLQQNEEMTRLLRRSWVKYCILHEGNQESLSRLYASNDAASSTGVTNRSVKLDIKGLVNSGDRLLDRLILKGLMDEKADDEGYDSGYSSSRGSNASEDDEEEQETQAQVREVQKRVKAKVQCEVVEDEMRLEMIGRWLGISLRR